MSDEGYESGPFCRHLGDLHTCCEVCATCGHFCHEHDHNTPEECTAYPFECRCTAFVDKPENAP